MNADRIWRNLRILNSSPVKFSMRQKRGELGDTSLKWSADLHVGVGGGVLLLLGAFAAGTAAADDDDDGERRRGGDAGRHGQFSGGRDRRRRRRRRRLVGGRRRHLAAVGLRPGARLQLDAHPVAGARLQFVDADHPPICSEPNAYYRPVFFSNPITTLFFLSR